MKEIVLKGLDEKIYYDQCDNGLKIYVWTNEKINTFKSALVFKGGAENTTFTIENKKITVPFGTAHYLEHILCKNADGSSLLGKFNELQSYSNASTYPDKTLYEFVGTTNFYENLELLLNSIQEKEFVEETFLSERGPILEEASMNKDNAGRLAYYTLNNELFLNYPNRIEGTGRVEDIKEITLQNLKDFYNTFYHPENSFLIVTGKVDPLEVIHFVKKNQKKKQFSKWIAPKFPRYIEPKKVAKTYQEIYANIEVPKIYIAVKVPIRSLPKMSIITLLDILQLLLVCNFGSTSLLKEELIDKKLIVSLSTSVDWERNYVILKVTSKTKYPEEVLPILKEKLKNLEGNLEDVLRKIKSEIANLVLSFEDPEYVNDLLAYMLVKYGKIITNEKEILENIKASDIEKVMKKLSMDEMSVLVMYPNKKDD